MEKRSGTSFPQGIENIQTVQGQTGRQEPDIGRQPELTSPLESPNHWVLRKHLFSMLAKPLKESKPTGSCMNIVLQMWIDLLAKRITWGYVLFSFPLINLQFLKILLVLIQVKFVHIIKVFSLCTQIYVHHPWHMLLSKKMIFYSFYKIISLNGIVYAHYGPQNESD